MTQDVGSTLSRILDGYILPLGWRLVGAVALWIVGGWLIRLLSRLLGRAMERQKLEPTLARYTGSTLQVVLRLVLIIANKAILLAAGDAGWPVPAPQQVVRQAEPVPRPRAA